MNTLTTILLVIAGLVALFLLLALFTKKGYDIRREIVINAPLENVFDYLKHIKNWDNFNKPAMADPDERREFKGEDGTIGFIYAWSGNKKVGQGEKEIKAISEGRKIETEIRFVKPFKLTGYTTMATDPASGTQTKVTFSNASTLRYPLNILIPMVEKGIARDMDASLSTLKTILEKESPTP